MTDPKVLAQRLKQDKGTRIPTMNSWAPPVNPKEVRMWQEAIRDKTNAR
jgi:hypothetical protein